MRYRNKDCQPQEVAYRMDLILLDTATNLNVNNESLLRLASLNTIRYVEVAVAGIDLIHGRRAMRLYSLALIFWSVYLWFLC